MAIIPQITRLVRLAGRSSFTRMAGLCWPVGGAGLQHWPARGDADGTTGLEIGPAETISPLRLESAALSPDGGRIAVGQLGEGVRVFDLHHSTNPMFLLAHENAIGVSFSPDGVWIATSTWHGTGVKLWEAKTGKLLRDLPIEGDTVAPFSPDGRWLESGTGVGFHFRKTDSWEPGHSVSRDIAGQLPSMAFTRDGKLVALTPFCLGVRLIEPDSGKEFATLNEGEQAPLSFSPDGNRLVTSDPSGTVRLWDMALIRPKLAAMKLDW